MKPIWIGREEIDAVFTMDDAIACAKEALASYSAGRCDIPLRTSVNLEDRGKALFMPGYDRASGALGVKVVAVCPGNAGKGLPVTPAAMVLMDAETGMVQAILDGTYITRLRTGAAGGAAIDLLARRDAAVFALFGTGGQAETQLEACLKVRSISTAWVVDIARDRAEAFAVRMAKRFSHLAVDIRVAASSEEAVENADIITAVTTAKTPVFDGRLVKRGCHVSSIGSYTPDMQEVDETVVCGADRRFADTLEGVLAESGCVIQPIRAGRLREADMTGELGELVLGTKSGRRSGDEITYFDCVGSAVLDVTAANQIYQRYRKSQGKGGRTCRTD